VNDATGAESTGGGAGVAGCRTMLRVAAWEAASVVAVNPPALPTATGPPLSASNDEIRPPPEPITSERDVTAAGGTQSVVADDLSDQYDTSHDPASGTDTVGVTWDVEDPGSDLVATAPTLAPL
jgi:hypothetical protein